MGSEMCIRDRIGDVCRALEIPITGGNVSLYNETDGEAIQPTPVIGVVGVAENAARILGRVFRREGVAVVLLGQSRAELGGSEYLKVVHGQLCGQLPHLDLTLEAALHHLLAGAAADGLLESAHDCAEGGLAVALAECCFESGGIGLEVSLPGIDADRDDDDEVLLAKVLFGATASRVVVSIEDSKTPELLRRATAVDVPAYVVGRTGGSRFRISVDETMVIDDDLAKIESAWTNGFARHFKDRAA